MTTPDYIKKMSQLRSKVGQYAKLPIQSNNSKIIITTTSSNPTINIQSPFFYIAPPIIILVILLIMKPNFICNDTIDIDNVITKKLNFNKLLITGLISGGIISIGLFYYFRNKTK